MARYGNGLWDVAQAASHSGGGSHLRAACDPRTTSPDLVFVEAVRPRTPVRTPGVTLASRDERGGIFFFTLPFLERGVRKWDEFSECFVKIASEAVCARAFLCPEFRRADSILSFVCLFVINLFRFSVSSSVSFSNWSF